MHELMCVCVNEIKGRSYDETERCEKKNNASTRWTELPVKAVTQLSVEKHSATQTFLKAIKMSEFLILLKPSISSPMQWV